MHDDIDAARAANRRTRASYGLWPNSRNYWRAAGYATEMNAVEKCIAAKRPEDVAAMLSDRWFDDVTSAGPTVRVRA